MTSSTSPISPEILSFYSTYDESTRLARGLGILESARTREIILPLLPAPPATIYDIGGGPGAHAVWLASLGHTVHLLDPVPTLLAQALDRAQQSSLPITATSGDARALPFPDRSADVLLLLGPLYHLTSRHDRLTTLREAHRVLRPGGLLFAAAISRYASLLYGIHHGLIYDPTYQAMCTAEISTGQHRTPPTLPHLFTTAYFHHPSELAEELTAANLTHQQTHGLEGPAWLVPDYDSASTDPNRLPALLYASRAAERDPILSPHMLAIARAP